jgi:hypothetical protein
VSGGRGRVKGGGGWVARERRGVVAVAGRRVHSVDIDRRKPIFFVLLFRYRVEWSRGATRVSPCFISATGMRIGSVMC